MGIHLALNPELHQRLIAYAKDRETNLSEVTRIALNRLFSTECESYKQELALRLAVSRHFSLPKAFHFRPFFLFLYKIATSYPDESSKEFWGYPIVYLSGIDKTHAEIYAEIADEVNRELQKSAS